MALQNAPIAKAQMLIRRPVDEVFEAFLDPNITTKFWFTKSSGRVEAGKELRWDWEMYGASAQVKVIAVEKNQKILIEWGGNGVFTNVEWLFTPHTDTTTIVQITNWGFMGTDEEQQSQALDSKGGFTWVLAGLKIVLEHGILPNFVADQYPEALK